MQYEPGLEAAPHTGLEPAPQNFPELAYPHQPGLPGGYPLPQHSQHYADSPLPYLSSKSVPAPSPSVASPYSAAAAAHSPPTLAPIKSRTVCGCTLLVFILSCIIALLSAAVIGLAAGTGIEAQRANDATNQLEAANSLLSAVAGTPTAVPGSNPTAVAVGTLDEGCAADPEGVTGTVYTSFGRMQSSPLPIYTKP